MLHKTKLNISYLVLMMGFELGFVLIIIWHFIHVISHNCLVYYFNQLSLTWIITYMLYLIICNFTQLSMNSLITYLLYFCSIVAPCLRHLGDSIPRIWNFLIANTRANPLHHGDLVFESSSFLYILINLIHFIFNIWTFCMDYI